MKKRPWFLLILIMMLLIAFPLSSYGKGDWDPEQYAREVPISAETAALIDVQSGRILYGKNMHKQMRIASLTKIITAIVAIESGRLEETVTTSKNAYRVEGSSIYLELGEKQKLIDLVYAIMLRSGNDAATAIAEHVGGGSIQKFAEMMNRKVKELGLTGTHFVNPHGLDAEDHYSTAHDMAVLTAYALRNPVFAEVVRTKVKRIPWEGKEWDRVMSNKNKMLYRYPGADGVKTGYTEAAGRCLASSATRDGRQLAVIVLNDRQDWDDSAKLLNYGFTKYEYAESVKEQEPVANLPVKNGVRDQLQIVAGSKLGYPVRAEEKHLLRKDIQLPKHLTAPVYAGEKVGEINLYFKDQKIGSVPLLAAETVEGTGLLADFIRFFKGLFK
ncbi:D-alanyl-D-alanine carboxypeptidase family protein [Effusibacillus lacus]|uniref:serine-type D-Ala-D-Ala carboxypeptidase n=1 Tax=Effusibacillus lacus TaxID=1348429 RepID=A0A292YTM9_9BACL|nr:D-alanyl-D-alanine carboxypeptidase family protein [Effusibacillus lacus]TCS76292.1 D-alanyl-D-alanine carboxypeptidase/D-alanyl-D-alanine carboxypeptidase (penicillin-binding protein 5/6) [Effusibacillus lacus]GAX91840.1 D-alanyl-D-alanine carboxypeptidase [Effusibacillus lacus]